MLTFKLVVPIPEIKPRINVGFTSLTEAKVGFTIFKN